MDDGGSAKHRTLSLEHRMSKPSTVEIEKNQNVSQMGARGLPIQKPGSAPNVDTFGNSQPAIVVGNPTRRDLQKPSLAISRSKAAWNCCKSPAEGL